jgi:hypothetical protein
LKNWRDRREGVDILSGFGQIVTLDSSLQGLLYSITLQGHDRYRDPKIKVPRIVRRTQYLYQWSNLSRPGTLEQSDVAYKAQKKSETPVVKQISRRESPTRQGGLTMICERCHGLMCVAELRDWASSPSQDSPDAFRCLTCGEIVDPVIRQNRVQAPPVKRRSRRKWDKVDTVSVSLPINDAAWGEWRGTAF